jgi:hypothetical protein
MHRSNGPSDPIAQPIFTALKMFAYTLVAPFLLVAVLASLLCVVLDFAWFRTHEMFLGNPEPKGLWEF